MLQEGDLADVALPGQKLSHSGKDMTEVKGISSRPAGVDAVAKVERPVCSRLVRVKKWELQNAPGLPTDHIF